MEEAVQSLLTTVLLSGKIAEIRFFSGSVGSQVRMISSTAVRRVSSLN